MTFGVLIKERVQNNFWISSILIGLVCGSFSPFFHRSLLIVPAILAAPILSVIITRINAGENKYLKLFFGATLSLFVAFTLFTLYMYFVANQGLQNNPSHYFIQSVKVFALGILGCVLLTFLVTLRK